MAWKSIFRVQGFEAEAHLLTHSPVTHPTHNPHVQVGSQLVQLAVDSVFSEGLPVFEHLIEQHATSTKTMGVIRLGAHVLAQMQTYHQVTLEMEHLLDTIRLGHLELRHHTELMPQSLALAQKERCPGRE